MLVVMLYDNTQKRMEMGNEWTNSRNFRCFGSALPWQPWAKHLSRNLSRLRLQCWLNTKQIQLHRAHKRNVRMKEMTKARWSEGISVLAKITWPCGQSRALR